MNVSFSRRVTWARSENVAAQMDCDKTVKLKKTLPASLTKGDGHLDRGK